MPEPAASLLDTRRFKIAVTAVLGLVACSTCVILGHRAVSYQRGVWGAALYASGEPVRAYPYLVNAAAAPLLGRLNAGPWLDMGEVAAWAIEDPRFRRFHPEVTPELAVRLAFVSHAEALLRRPTSSTAMAGLADLFRRVRTLRVKASTPSLADLAAPEGGGTRSPEDALVEAAYRKAIEMEPSNYFWYAYLADFFTERGRRGEALELYGRAIELMPDLGWHYYLGAGGPMEPDLFETAREGLMRALQTNVVFRREKIESNLGYLHERQRDFEGALRHYRRAIQIAADKSQYLYQAGTIFAFQGRTDEAIEYYRRALDKGTLNRRLELAALQQLGRALADRGEHKAAAGYLARARELDPGSYQTRVELGRAWFDAGEISRAESELKNAVQVDPSRPEAYAALISLYRSRGDFARAIPLARRLVEIQPQDRGWKDLLDELYRQVGPDPPGGS